MRNFNFGGGKIILGCDDKQIWGRDDQKLGCREPRKWGDTPKIGDFGETPDFKEIAPKREGSKNGGFGEKIGKIQKKDLFLGGPGGTF